MLRMSHHKFGAKKSYCSLIEHYHMMWP